MATKYVLKSNIMTECSYCNEPLNEDEINYFNLAIQEIPLCSECLLTNF